MRNPATNAREKLLTAFRTASVGLCMLLASGPVHAQSPSSGRWVLRSAKQADRWQDAFVTGNGTHGMMVMGNSISERITNVHEELFLRAWDRAIVGVPNIAQHLAAQRQLIAEGKNNDAFFVYGDAINQANAAGAGATWELTPHPAFDLHLDHASPGGLLSYANELDLESGEASCRWQRSNTAVDQRVFSSRIANVNVVSLKATNGKKLNLTLSLGETPGRGGMHLGTFNLDTAFSSVTTQSEPGWLTYRAKYSLDSGGYEGCARVTHVGGSMVKVGNALTVTDADELLVLIRITPLADGNSTVETAVKAELSALSTDYAQLLQPHAVQHGEMFERVTLDLGAANAWLTDTTQEMLQEVSEKGPSAHYLEAVHAMGRYLLISSCGKYPPPLRGIWGGDWKADWAGGFVLDSNLDLAMSAAGPGNLPECIESYAGYIERQLPGWRLNATNTFGTRGFMAASFGSPETGYQSHKNPAHWYYVCQAGWTLRPLYDYALLSKNDAFMQNRVLPLYLEMANFYDDYMVADGNGVLHITPGCSPESNTPSPYDSQIADDCTIDLAVAKEVYQVLIEQGPKFGISPAQITAWQNIRNNIAPYRIDSNGALSEWAPAKYNVVNYGSRHNSHLYPIFPGYELFQSGSSTQLLEAARVALQKRIETEHLQLYDELSGHGIMYAAMMSARMREVGNVNKLLNHIARNGFQYDSMVTSHCPNGRYYNMDVGMSLPRLLMEMLVFSHPGNIDLMPGWNAELPAGSCNDMLVRGGHKISIAWAGGTMNSAVLHAGANETLTVRFGAQSASIAVVSGQQYELKNLFPGPQPLPSVQVLGLSNPTANGCSPSQTIAQSVDGNINTKWCASHGGKPLIWQMAYASPPAQALRAYSFTSAEDVPGRDPIRWTLEGSQDGVNWTVLDERDLGTPFANRKSKKNFGTSNTVSYRAYRFVFQPSATESMFQVAEVALDFTGANYATGHVPANLATGISQSPTLSWTAGTGGTRHDVYFGTSESAVRSATTASPEYKGRKTTTSYAAGALSPGTTYYWRIDETISTGTPIYSGHTVRFTTAGVAPPVVLPRALPELSGKSVAIWSKFTGRFVRSPGVVGGTLIADRDAYDRNGGEGRFLCAAEAGGTIALMDLLLQKYVTVVNGPLVPATAGTPENRRFTLEDQGNNYYAIRAENGFYVRAGPSGDLAADAGLLTEESLFSIVPIRDGPNVVMRAYNGDDPQNQISDTIPNEVALFCDNPADFPVNKVNIRTLQMTAGLSTDQQLIEMRKVWNTKGFEDEAIIPYSTTAPLTTQLDSIVNGIKRIESLGYSYDYIILYHEILANLPGGPWSDPRISSPEEINLLRERILLGYNRGDLKHPTYKIFTMPYQFQTGSTMGIAPFENTPVGCDAATLAFIKENFDGLFLEVNGHDYLSRNEHVDAAQAAAWCRANGLEFGITSGLAASKDTVYKSMYQNIFAQMAAVGFDKSWSGMHYILHHVYQQYADRLPEWVTNATTENSRWLIEQVMPPETWALSGIDSDGDGTEDEAEIRAGTFPFGAGGLLERPDALAYDDFYGYGTGALSGQVGDPVGFGGVWTSSGATVDAASRTVTQTGGSYRSYRSFSPAPLATSGTVQVRATLALAANANYSGLELATTAGSDVGSIRLANANSNLHVSVVGTVGVSSPVILANDGQAHQWLLELNLDTRQGRAWIDADPTSTPGAAFTIPTGFQLNAVNLATFALGQPGDASVQLQEILILPGAVSTQAGLFEDPPSVYGQEAIVNGHDNATLVDFNHDGTLDFSSDQFLYRNDGGAALSFARNFGDPCVWADFDNDSLLDQFVWAGGGSLLRPENLDGTSATTFHDDAIMPMLPSLTANGACWGDWNNDGHVDLYVTGHELSKAANGGFPDTILMNNGGTQFTSNVLTATNDNRARGVAACDFDQDGDLDIFVSNSRQRANILWLNNGSGSFIDVATARGVAGDGTNNNDRGDTIGSCWGDFNNDGLFDLFVANSATTDPAQDRSMLLQNSGPGAGYTFQKRWTLDGSFYQESHATSMVADYDNDGDLDLFVTTANSSDRSKLFRNDGNWAFTDVTDAEGLPSDLGQTTAAAWGDVNNDGFPDLLTNNRLFTNRGNTNKWLKVRLTGDGVNINRAAIGARVRIDLGGGRILVRQVEGGSGKGSQNDLTLHFGMGTRTAPVDLQITWPGGTVETMTNVAVGQTVVVGDPEPVPALTASPAMLAPVCRQSENAPSQQFTVQSSTRLPVEFTISDNASWLLTPVGGVALHGEPTPVEVAYDTSLLAPGTYTATITLTSGDVSNSPQTLAVTLTVASDRTWTGAGGDNNWSTGANWGGTTPFQHDSLIFGGDTRLSNSNNFAADTPFGSVSFDTAAGAFTLSGNRITLGGNIGFPANPSAAVTQTINLPMILSADRTITTQANGAFAVGGIISGSGKLTKAGDGVLTLSGANSHGGGTRLETGTLNINNSSALGSGPFTLAGTSILDNSTGADIVNTQNNPLALNADFTFTGTRSLDLGSGNVTLNASRMITVSANTLTLRGDMGGSGYGLTKIGPGSLALSGQSTYTGTIAVREGSLSATTIADSGSSSLGLGTSLWMGYQATTGTLNYTGTGDTTVRTLQMGYGNKSNYRGGATINANGVNGGSGLLFSAANFTVAQTNTADVVYRTLTLGGSNTDANQISGTIADVNAGVTETRLAKAGAGRWILAGANTYTGITTVNGGTLLVDGDSSAATGTVTVNNTSTLGGSGIIGGAVTVYSGGSLSPGGASAAVGTLTASALTFQTTSLANFDLTTDTAVGGGTNDLVVVNGNLAAGGTIQVNVLSSLNTGGSYRLFNYSGTLTGSFAVTVPNTRYVATLNTATPGQVNVSFSLAPVTLTWKGMEALNNWDLNASANWHNGTGNTVFQNSDAVVFDGTAVRNDATLLGTLAPLSVTVNNSADVILQGGGKLGGDMFLIKNGTGPLTVSTANDYTGTTTLNSGTLNINNASALGSGLFTIAGASTLDNTSAADIVNTQNNPIMLNADFTFTGTRNLDLGSGSITLNATTRVITANAKTLTLGGDIGGIGYGLTKTGPGTLALSGQSTYTGTTAVRDGALSATTIADSGSSSLGLGTNLWMGYQATTGTLNYSGTGDTTVRTLQMGYGNKSNMRGGATINANGANGGSGLVFSAPNFTTVQTNTADVAYRTLTLGGSNTDANQISGVIANVNGSTTLTRLTKADAGRWILAGANTYTGITTVSTGTLLINGNSSAATGDVAVNGSSTLGGSGILGGTVIVAASANLSPGASASVGTLAILGGLNISASAGGTGKLIYRLGPIDMSDKIAVTGTLTIGSGALGFSDFNFSALAGLANGTYTLITSGGISGTLDPVPANLTGPIGSGTGILQKNGTAIELVVSNPYQTWSGGAPFNADANNDGVKDGLAWLLGAANPNVNATGLLPSPNHGGGALVLAFRMRNAASRGGALVQLQHSSDLGLTDPWSTPVTVPETGGTVGGVTFTVTPDGVMNDVEATIPSAESASGKLFGRLNGVSAP